MQPDTVKPEWSQKLTKNPTNSIQWLLLSLRVGRAVWCIFVCSCCLVLVWSLQLAALVKTASTEIQVFIAVRVEPKEAADHTFRTATRSRRHNWKAPWRFQVSGFQEPFLHCLMQKSVLSASDIHNTCAASKQKLCTGKEKYTLTRCIFQEFASGRYEADACNKILKKDCQIFAKSSLFLS